MLILFLNHKGYSIGRQHIENGFIREGDYILNRKVIKAKCSMEINTLLLRTTDDTEVRLISGQKQLLVSPYPDLFNDLYYQLGAVKLFPIGSLKVPIYNKAHYKDRFEPPTEEIIRPNNYGN